MNRSISLCNEDNLNSVCALQLDQRWNPSGVPPFEGYTRPLVGDKVYLTYLSVYRPMSLHLDYSY